MYMCVVFQIFFVRMHATVALLEAPLGASLPESLNAKKLVQWNRCFRRELFQYNSVSAIPLYA